jgi:hypothetical protein
MAWLQPKLLKTCWASLLPRQNSPRLAGLLCYITKTCQNLLGLFATLPKIAKTSWAFLLPRQNSPKLAGPFCYLAKTRQNLLGLFATSPKLAKTGWASLLPRQNLPKLAGPLCYLAKTFQNFLGLFATLPKLAKLGMVSDNCPLCKRRTAAPVASTLSQDATMQVKACQCKCNYITVQRCHQCCWLLHPMACC